MVRRQHAAVVDQLHPVDGGMGARAQAVWLDAGRPAWVQFKLAELKADIECLRALTYQACEHYIAGEDVTEWATMAKLKAGRLNRTVPDTCLQFWGGMGFTWENKVSRMYRDGRLASIGGGADEVMLGILSKMMGIAKRPQK